MLRNYIGGFIGLAGAGKSVSLAQLCIWELLKGRRVWSNLPVEIKKGTAIYNRKTFFGTPIVEMKTEPLDMNLLYLLDESLAEGTIAIDEAGYYADSRQSGSIKNRLINACVRQARHRQINLFYTAFDFFRIDGRLRAETDFLVECSDLANTHWGEDVNADDGVFIIRRWYDLTGKMTRGKCVSVKYPKEKIPYKAERFKALPYWACYDTAKSQDLEEAFSRVQLDMVTRISNRNSYNQETQYAVLDTLRELKLSGYERIRTNELWDELSKRGIEGNAKFLGQYIPRNIRRGWTRNGGSYYDLSNLVDDEMMMGIRA